MKDYHYSQLTEEETKVGKGGEEARDSEKRRGILIAQEPSTTDNSCLSLWQCCGLNSEPHVCSVVALQLMPHPQPWHLFIKAFLNKLLSIIEILFTHVDNDR
jgi:hypothetical protein